MARPSLSPKLREEYSEKLQDTLDELDVAREKRRTITKALKGHEELLDQAIYTLRRRLKGLDLEQTELPGTEAGEPKRDPLVMQILKAAGEVAERKEKELEDLDEEDEPNEKPTARGSKKAGPAPLRWHTEGENLVSDVFGGCYCIEPAPMGGKSALWTPAGGKSKSLVRNVNEGGAKNACEQHHLEHQADGILSNAGAGELTKGALKGEAVARKAGRRG